MHTGFFGVRSGDVVMREVRRWFPDCFFDCEGLISTFLFVKLLSSRQCSAIVLRILRTSCCVIRVLLHVSTYSDFKRESSFASEAFSFSNCNLVCWEDWIGDSGRATRATGALRRRRHFARSTRFCTGFTFRVSVLLCVCCALLRAKYGERLREVK